MTRPARRSAVILGTALLLAPLPALACRDGRAEMSDPSRYCAPWSVHDGDTPRAITPIGTCERLRLRDCNAPELDAPGGPAARDRLARWLAQGARIEFALRRDGRLKRGRYCRPLVIVRLDGHSFCETVQ